MTASAGQRVTTTLARVPEPRDARPQDIQAILDALAEKDAAQEKVEKKVARALLNGASIRAVQDGTGLSPNTIRAYGLKHGWPTAENRANFNKAKYPRRPR